MHPQFTLAHGGAGTGQVERRGDAHGPGKTSEAAFDEVKGGGVRLRAARRPLATGNHQRVVLEQDPNVVGRDARQVENDLEVLLPLHDIHGWRVQPTWRGIVCLLQVLEEPAYLVGKLGRLWKRQHEAMIAWSGGCRTAPVDALQEALDHE